MHDKNIIQSEEENGDKLLFMLADPIVCDNFIPSTSTLANNK